MAVSIAETFRRILCNETISRYSCGFVGIDNLFSPLMHGIWAM